MSWLALRSDSPGPDSVWRRSKLFRNSALAAIRKFWSMRSPHLVGLWPDLSRIADIGQSFHLLHEDLGQLVDSVLHQSIARSRNRSGAMRHAVDCAAHR